MSSGDPTTERCTYVVGEDGLARWSGEHADAWLGLLQTYRRLTRELETELERRHGISLSGLELLGRLAAADGRRLRLSALADGTGLSLSRVSRIVDGFERRGLVERVACSEDARGTYAHLTDDGLRSAGEAQASHVEDVQRRFFARLAPDELRVLARVFADFDGKEPSR
jgi:DNA-binding MarR family transcriptional regulator